MGNNDLQTSSGMAVEEHAYFRNPEPNTAASPIDPNHGPDIRLPQWGIGESDNNHLANQRQHAINGLQHDHDYDRSRANNVNGYNGIWNLQNEINRVIDNDVLRGAFNLYHLRLHPDLHWEGGDNGDSDLPLVDLEDVEPGEFVNLADQRFNDLRTNPIVNATINDQHHINDISFADVILHAADMGSPEGGS